PVSRISPAYFSVAHCTILAADAARPCLLPVLLFFFYSSANHQYLHSFPTRRSSDLAETVANIAPIDFAGGTVIHINAGVAAKSIDRKSTRLNSSHVSISYAVFCLKKKKKSLLTLSITRLDIDSRCAGTQL